MKKGMKIGLTALGALALAALLLAPQLTSKDESVSPAASAAPLSAVQRREAAYQRDVSALTELLKDETADEDAKSDARIALADMVGEHQTELALAAALEQAGYAPCLVVARGGGVTVTAGRERLTDEDAERILSVCLRHAELSPESIRIMAGELD